jgi:hypothetical protein
MKRIFINLILQKVPRKIFAFLATLLTIFTKILDRRAIPAVVYPGKSIFFVVMFRKWFCVPDRDYVFQFIMPRPFQRWLSVRRGDTVIEGGSAIGEDTVRIAEIVGDLGRIIAIEPNPLNIVYLKRNIGYYNNVVLLDRALWNSRGVLKLYLSTLLPWQLFVG